MANLLRKIIEWLFFKYVVDHYVEAEEADMGDYEIEFEPDFQEEMSHDEILDALSYSLGGAFELLIPKFDNEVDKAMWEKEFHTIH